MIEVSRDEFEPTRHADGGQSAVPSIVALSLGLIVMVCVTATASAEPPQTAPGSGATGAAAPIPARNALEEELQQFAKLPVDKAMKAYWKGLVEVWQAESEYDRLRLQADQAFTSRCESEFKKRVPGDLAETFKRMTDRSATQARFSAIWKMQEPERAAAVARDAAEEQRVWKLRRQFDDELEHGKIAELAKSKSETAERIKAEDSKIQSLRARAEKFEANLFPRMSRDQVVTMRQFVNPHTRFEEDKLEELKKTLGDTMKESSLKEIQCRMPPELDAAFRRATDRKAREQRRDETRMLHGAERTAAKRKDADEDRKLHEIA